MYKTPFYSLGAEVFFLNVCEFYSFPKSSNHIAQAKADFFFYHSLPIAASCVDRIVASSIQMCHEFLSGSLYVLTELFKTTDLFKKAQIELTQYALFQDADEIS